jgi:pimeloyl-ACP methyl ester carboxylesterase
MINSILDRRALRIEHLMALRAFGGGSFFGEAEGEGPAEVLALHGWGRRGSDFAVSLQGLSYLAIDLPGFGASPVPSQPMGAKGYADLIKEALDHLSPKPVLVGHSFGGRVAVALAAAHPGRFGGLVLTGVPLVRRISTARAPRIFRLGRWLERRGLIAEERMESLRRKYGSADYTAARGVMRQILVMGVNESYEAELRDLSVPVTLLWGENDSDVPLFVAEAAQTILRKAGTPVNLRVVEGAGHFVPSDSPHSLRQAVEEMRSR